MPFYLVMAVAFAAAGTLTSNATRPLHLTVEEQGATTILRVVGAANELSSVAYDLEVTDGGNRSVQRGVAHLDARTETTVVTVRLTPRGQLLARLNVQPVGAASYAESYDSR